MDNDRDIKFDIVIGHAAKTISLQMLFGRLNKTRTNIHIVTICAPPP
jgi:hypothetical protein